MNSRKGTERMRAARDARVREGLDTDYALYNVISKKPGASVYELAKTLGWSSGKVYGSVRRLEKDNWIKTEKAERKGRSVLKVKSVEWVEFLTPEEIDEFKNMNF
jgi:DNA-binding PadR family transcriptional regulator